jgi:hypothetical protein
MCPNLAEIRVTFVLSLQQMLYVVPVHVNITVSSSSQRSADSFENCWFQLNILTSILCSLLQYR